MWQQHNAVSHIDLNMNLVLHWMQTVKDWKMTPVQIKLDFSCNILTEKSEFDVNIMD